MFSRHVFIFCIFLISSLSALKIEITEGTRKAIPIAVVDFKGDTKEKSVADVIRQDLLASGLFIPVSNSGLALSSDMNQAIDYSSWQKISANFLVLGQIDTNSDGLKIDFVVYDIASKQNILGLSVTVDNISKWRRAGHMIADAIYQRITGEAPFFDSSITFVSETGSKGRRQKTIMVADWDGHNAVAITSGNKLVLTPRYAPNNQEIAYLSYESEAPKVVLMNIATKSKKDLGAFSGMTFAPKFSSDGNFMVMSLAKGGSSAVYKLDLRTNALSQLTSHKSIDTSPCFSPQITDIVFTSDRDGIEQLYVMNVDGSNVHRISFGGGKYSQPIWSPRGDMIAFTKQIAGKGFFIGVMNKDGTGERVIASGYLVEAPSWSPNGRYLMFTRENNIKGSKGLSKIHMIDITGYGETVVKTPHDASDISWSNLRSRPLIQN